MNTSLALFASALSSAFVRLPKKMGKFDMRIVLRANLAGGVMIGCNSEFITSPLLALSVGLFAGIVCAPCMTTIDRLSFRSKHIHDTAGMLYISGIPGIIGAILSWLCILNIETLFKNTYAI